MDTKLTSSIIGKINRIEFENAVQLISPNVVFESNSAIKIFVALCSACSKNMSTPLVISTQHLSILLRHFVKFIKQGPNIDTYLRAIFHILKFLIAKEEFVTIYKLQSVYVPEFLEIIRLDVKEKQIYQSCCKSIYNAIINTGRSTETSLPILLKLCYFLSSMHKKCNEDTQMVEDAFNCSLVLVHLGIESLELNQYYNSVLNNLQLPNKNELFKKSLLNYFSYNLNYLLKRTEMKIAQMCLKETVDKLKSICPDKETNYIINLFTILNFMMTGCDMKLIVASRKALKDYHQIKSNEILKSTCTVISSASITISQYFLKNPNEWIKIAIDAQESYSMFLFDIAQIISQFEFKCTCCEDCKTTKQLFDAFKMIHIILQYARLNLMHKDDKVNEKELMNIITRYLEKEIDIIVELKNNRCNKWETCWYDCGLTLYNSAIHFSKRNNDICSIFFKYCAKYLIQLEGTDSSILGANIPQSCLSFIAQRFYQEKDLKNSIIASSFCVAISSNSSEMQRWISYRAEQKNNSINDLDGFQELTLPMILDKFTYEIQFYYPDFKLTQAKRESLLILELKTYKKYWKSKTPMMAAYRELFNIAEVSTLVEIFIEVWGHGDLYVDPQIPKLLKQTITRFEVKLIENVADKIKLAQLYYLQNKYRVQDAIMKNNDDMDKTLNMTKMPENNGLEPMESNEECDIVSSYENLRLSRYIKMMKSLNKALDILSSVISVESNHLKCLDINLYKLLKLIANEFRLHANKIRCIQAWQMALTIAQKLNDDVCIMQSTGALIEFSNSTQSYLMNLVKRADYIAGRLDEQKYLEEIVNYYMCKAFGCFEYDFETAYRAFKIVNSFHQKFEHIYILRARFMLLYHKLILLPCKLNVEGHDQFNLGLIHIAYNNAIKHYSENKSNDMAYDMSLFFEITEEIGRFYQSLRMPREVRCYCKEVVLVTQRLVLPLRTMSLLYYLAYADIVSCRFDDCIVKLSGLDDILCLSKSRTPLKSPKVIKKEIKILEDINKLSNEFGEMILDAPGTSKAYTQYSAGSPTFCRENFKIPTYFYHEDECNCFYCISPEIQNFVLKKAFLYGLLNVYEKNTPRAKDFFRGGIKIYELVIRKEDIFVTKLQKKMGINSVPNIQLELLPSYCSILLEYVNSLCRVNCIFEAKALNKKLLTSIKAIKFGNYFLYQEALCQNLTILAYSVNDPKVQINHLEVENGVLPTVKTPESKMSKVAVPFSPISSKVTPHFKKPIPAIRFDLSDDEDSVVEVKKTSTKSKATKNYKTPGPNVKMKIYTGSTSKSKKPRHTTKSDLNEAILVPSSDQDGFTSGSESDQQIDAHLKMRTKLLTDRLKSSSKKVKSNKNTVNGESSARKNLLPESQETVENKRVLRSTRSKPIVN